MKNNKLFDLISMLLGPVLLMVLGIILIVDPDSASALVAKVIAWALILTGTGLALKNLVSERRKGQIVAAAISLVVGLWMLANPLILARSLGRILGLVIFLQAADFREWKNGIKVSGVSLVTAILGLILVLVPMTASRILFVIIGIVCLVIGVTEIVNRLHIRKKLDRDDGPDIIDVEKV